MDEITQSERIASERLSSLESPARRLLMKGMVGLGATLASSSLSAAIAAQTQSHQPGAPGNQVPPVQGGWGPFTPSSERFPFLPYGAGPGGVWIISPEGKHLSTIKVPERVSNVAWGDKDGKTLLITASTSVYRIELKFRECEALSRF